MKDIAHFIAGFKKFRQEYFDISVGQLYSYCPESAAFERIG
ncbi:MAG: hypothetical protein PHF56_07020 [Desulfuromonadaceae bacterium]|nr:hypothetical protein [Desulfuromonadaceae bacterium]